MSKKQKFLDLETENVDIQITQEILKTMNKTQITNALRSFVQLEKTLWKSWMKQSPFESIHGCLTAANAVIKEDGNEMES